MLSSSGWCLGPLTASSTTLPDAVWGMGHGAVLGDEGKAVGCVPPTALLFEFHRHENAA
jgi:hypothetical protein